MPPEYINLSLWDVSFAAALILISGAISVGLQLGLERRLLLAAVRTVVQLLLIGLVLLWIFAPGRPWYFVVGLATVMTLIAGGAAVRRTERRYRGVWLDSVISMWTSSWLVAAVALFVVIRVQRHGGTWFPPQYIIPLLGMILGNTLNGISLGFDRLGKNWPASATRSRRHSRLGATRWEAARAAVQTAVRTGMIPTINSMMVVGLVSLPGMMTGQLLGGMNAMQAVMYQIVIMFVIAAGTALGTVSIVLLSYRRLFTPRHQFLPAKLAKQRP